MKIIIHGLNFSPEIVGIGKYSGELARSLVDLGHQVTVITAPPYFPQWSIQPGYSGCWWKTESVNNLKIIRCPIWIPKNVTGLNRIFLLLSFALSSFSALMKECGYKPDLVIGIEPTLFAAPFTIFACKWHHTYSWLHIQDFEVDATLDLGFIQRIKILCSISTGFERWVHAQFDHVSTISHKMVERLIDKGVPIGKTSYFPNWVDTNEIFPLDQPNQYRQDFGFTADDIVVLYSGSFGLKQGIEIIIEIANLIKSNLKIKFIICGDGPNKPILKKMADQSTNIYFLSLQPFEHLNELLNMADIHILPQKLCASDLVMPSKLLGILSSGKPVIAGCIVGSELYNVVNSVGIAVKPEDSSAFAQAIVSLSEDNDLRIKMGKKGREFAKKEYSRKAIIEKLLYEIETLITNNNHS